MLVSVIIPCFNVEEYITECLESVYSQTYKNIEVICVDNNSTDKTIDILQELKLRYPTLTIESESKSGANNARNKGLDIANGEWVQFLDADDLLMSKKIAHQVSLIQASQKKNIAFIAASSIKRTIAGREITINPLNDEIYLAPFVNRCGNTCSNLWKRNHIMEVDKWNKMFKSSQETDLMFRLILSGGSYLVDIEPLTIIRERESGQISQGDPGKKWKQYINVRLSYIETLKHKQPSEYSFYKPAFFDYLMVSIITLAKYDKSSALKYFNKHIKNEWETSSQYGFNKFKYLFIKCFGLRFSLFFLNK